MAEAAELIKGHNDAVRTFSESRVRYRTVCAACGKNSFTPHELRRRTLRYVVDNLVESVAIWLARWRCKNCDRSFTDYPPFRLAV